MNPLSLPPHLLGIFAIFVSAALAPAQTQHYQCSFGGEENAEALAHALSSDKTCAIAAERLSQCRWGSSADTGFAPIVISKCEKDFYDKLSAAGKDRYGEEMQLCAYQYAHEQGTLAMSAAAMCQVDVAAEFAAHLERGDLPYPRASFDCQKAQTLLEKTICSDIRLGNADIVLGRVYKNMLAAAKGNDRAKLIESERKWLAKLPGQCGLGGPTDPRLQRLCLRNEMETRFTNLDCDAEIGECIDTLDDPAGLTSDNIVISGERASFDCEKPVTALQIVVCADSELGQRDIQMAEIIKSETAQIDSAQGSDLSASQEKWSRFAQQSCPMGVVGGIPSWLTRACVREAYDQRISQVQACAKKPIEPRHACLNDFTVPGDTPNQ